MAEGKNESVKRPANWMIGFCVTAGLLLVAVYGCPIYEITGICCPCCGVTRAWLSFFQGDVAAAFRYHALFPILPLVGILYIWNAKIPHKWIPIVNVAFVVTGVAVAVYAVFRWCGLVAMP